MIKRVAISIIVCLATTICLAQDHFEFLGLPIGGSLEQFAERLVNEKGFVLSDTIIHDSINFNMDVRRLEGCFEDFDDCVIFIRQMEGKKEVSSVLVYADTLEYNNEVFEGIIKKYDKQFGPHTYFWHYYKWETNKGRILASYEDGYYTIAFLDKPEMEIRDELYEQRRKEMVDSLVEQSKKAQTVREICSVPFGTSYERAKEMLEKKYGYPEYNPDRTVITYKNKNYAGILFDSIHFLFQSDGIRSYMNGCVFILNAKTLSEAKKKQEMLHEKLSEKYTMLDEIDRNGNKYYLGGYSPIPEDEGVGFTIEILKYDSELSKIFDPYAARLAYGRYNYVKEEF